MGNVRSATERVKDLAALLKHGDVGAVAGDVEAIADFIYRALNDGREEDVATLARLANALRPGAR